MPDIDVRIELLSYEKCPLCQTIELHFDRKLPDDVLGSRIVMRCDCCESEQVYRVSKELLYFSKAPKIVNGGD